MTPRTTQSGQDSLVYVTVNIPCDFLSAAENPSSDSVPVSGDGIPSLSHSSQPSEENSNSSMGTGVPPRGPEPPDLADKSSQSSLASLEDTGLIQQYLIMTV